MGKAKRNKTSAAKDARRRKRKQAGSAESPYQPGPLPTPPSAPRLSADQQRALFAESNALQFLLNFLNYVRDSGFDVPMDQFGPPRPGETPEQAQLRREKARRIKEIHAGAGNWAELAAEVLGWIALDTAGAVIDHIVEIGRGWLTTTRFTPEREDWRAGAASLLGALCPHEHWLDALGVLDHVGTMGIEPGDSPPQLAEDMSATPAAAIYAAAALVAWLYGQRAVVLDQTATMRTLAEKSIALAQRIDAGSTATGDSQPDGARISRPEALGILFLINYLNFVDDLREDLDQGHEPRRPDESDEEYIQRRNIRRLQKEIQAIKSDRQVWRESAAEDLGQVRAEEAGPLAASLLLLGRTWCEKTGFTPPIELWNADATELLDALCPSEYRAQAQIALDVLCVPPDRQTEEFAKAVPASMARPTIHAAAALVAWLYFQPECVSGADRARVGLDLGDRARAYFSRPR